MAGSTNYPGALDAWTDKVDGVDSNHADDVNDAHAAIVAIETELGVNPSGSAATVAARLTTIEGSIGGGGAVSSVVGATGAVTGTQILADSTVAAALAAKLSTAAASGTYVPLAGAATVAGVKTFSSSPVVPTASPADASTKAASTAYADLAAASAAAGATLQEAFGSTLGQIIKPWQPSATFGIELWQTGNMVTGPTDYQAVTTSPTLTCNGTTKKVKSAARLGYAPADPNTEGNLSPGDASFRVAFDYDISGVTTGWAGISLQLMTGGPATFAGATKQWVATAASSRKAGRFEMDFRVAPASAVATTYLEIDLEAENNAPSGTVSISNVTVRATGGESRPMLAAGSGGGDPWVWWQLRDLNEQSWKVARLSFAGDGALTPYAYNGISAYASASPWSALSVDPTFVRSASGSINADVNRGDIFPAGTKEYVLRANNNDQILSVETPGGQFDGTELYGNVHGGETPRGSATFKVDYGAGLVAFTPSSSIGFQPCRRYQVNLPSQFARAALNSGTPFANVDRLVTVFPDGMTRVDRTTTFLSTVKVGVVFEWMSSHSLGDAGYGRMGRGLTPTGQIDTRVKLNNPVISTVTTATTGGTLTAGTYSYRVAAVSVEGETQASAAVTVTSTGSTSANTVSWSAVTGTNVGPSLALGGTPATSTPLASVLAGYRVYGRLAGVERLLATVGPGVTSWVDDGSALLSDKRPVTSNSAVYYGASGEIWCAYEAMSSDLASWAVWYDPRSGFAYGNIYDREAVLARPNVTGVRLRMYGGKQYLNQMYADQGVFPGARNRLTVASGTVWSATHWSFVYIPADRTNWHNEIAVRAANLSALKALYPTT